MDDIEKEVNTQVAKTLHHIIIKYKGSDAFLKHLNTKNFHNSDGTQRIIQDWRTAPDSNNEWHIYLDFKNESEVVKYPFYYSRVVSWFMDFVYYDIKKITWEE